MYSFRFSHRWSYSTIRMSTSALRDRLHAISRQSIPGRPDLTIAATLERISSKSITGDHSILLVCRRSCMHYGIIGSITESLNYPHESFAFCCRRNISFFLSEISSISLFCSGKYSFIFKL